MEEAHPACDCWLLLGAAAVGGDEGAACAGQGAKLLRARQVPKLLQAVLLLMCFITPCKVAYSGRPGGLHSLLTHASSIWLHGCHQIFECWRVLSTPYHA